MGDGPRGPVRAGGPWVAGVCPGRSGSGELVVAPWKGVSRELARRLLVCLKATMVASSVTANSESVLNLFM